MRRFCRNGSFILKNVIIKNCSLSSDENAVAGIIETGNCSRKSSSEHKMRLSNVSFKRNENWGGSVGVVIRNKTCYPEVEFHNVHFEDNVYTSPSSLSKNNSLTNVRVIANRWEWESSEKGAFFHFPKGSSSTVKNLTAMDNLKTVVLKLRRGEMRILDSVFANNNGLNVGTVQVQSSSLTVKNSSFLNNSCDCYGAAIGTESSSAEIAFSEFSENDAGDFGGTVDMRYPRNVSFTSCSFTENVMRGRGSGAAVYFYGNLENTSGGLEMTKRIEFKDCVFLENQAMYGTAVYFSKIQRRAIFFDSCHIANNTASWSMPDDVHVRSAIGLINSHVKEFMMRNCTFKNNTGLGGAALSFHRTSGDIHILGSRFSNNHDQNDGGSAVFLEGQYHNTETRCGSKDVRVTRKPTVRLAIDSSEFANNTGEHSSGAVLVTGKSVHVHLNNSSFESNRGKSGAAVCIRDAHQLDVTNCTFRNNCACDGEAGGILSEKTPAIVQNCTFTKNKSQYGGGAIEAMSNITIQNSEFSENSAAVRGGAVNVNCEENDERIENCTAMIRRCTFNGNHAAKSGGAIHIYAESNLTIEDCLFHDNEATFGGGLSFCRVVNEGQWKIMNSAFVRNNASIGGNLSNLSCSVEGSCHRSHLSYGHRRHGKAHCPRQQKFVKV